MKVLVTGAAGFIGSNVVDRLLAEGHEVVGFDNLSTGRLTNLQQAAKSPRFALDEGDLYTSPDAIARSMRGVELVIHLAANADVRFGTDHPRRDLEQNTIATANVLEAMRMNNVKRIGFASTGSVYGEAEVFPTPEEAPFPIQTSLYGASKLAAEAMISAYAEGFGMQGYIFRFVSILGERYSHGHVLDFYRQLREHPDRLKILGDGSQRKSYLYVQDCISAILTVIQKSEAKVNIYNLGTDEYCTVNDSIGWICEELGLQPQREYTGGNRGWIGDNPFIFLDCKRLRSLGWQPELTIRDAVVRTLRYLRAEDAGAASMSSAT